MFVVGSRSWQVGAVVGSGAATGSADHQLCVELGWRPHGRWEGHGPTAPVLQNKPGLLRQVLLNFTLAGM